MDLWIRSQDKRTLVNTRRIDVDDNKIIIWDEGKYASDVFMGEYATTKRALEVLDEINNAILTNKVLELTVNKIPVDVLDTEKASKLFKDIVYEMPKE